MSRQITAILIDEHAATVITADGDHIEQHPIPLDAEATPPQRVRTIAQSMNSIGKHDSEIVLAIPSGWCLAAAVEVDNGAKRSHEALGYRLEEHLPIAAEDFVADFAPGSTPGSAPPREVPLPSEGTSHKTIVHDAPSEESTQVDTDGSASTRLGVCVQITQLDDLIGALEDEGVRIGWICPTALLAGQGVIDSAASGRAALVMSTNGHADVLISNAESPVRWFISSSEPLALDRVLRAENLHDSITRVDDPEAEAGVFATRVARGQVVPWVNLRRDALAVTEAFRGVRTPLAAFVLACVFLLIGVAGAMLWRAHNYQKLADDNYVQQLDLLKNTLPDHRVLAAPRLQLASAHRRLAGVRGSTDSPDLTASALNNLVRLLESLPPNVRFRVLELRLDPDRIVVDGQARSHGDADAVAQSLRQRGGFDVAPPRTQALKDGGVSFVLQLSPGSASGSASASAPGTPGGVEP